MLKVAITGNIAAGKSAAEAFFAEKGFCVVDCDKINASLLNDRNNVIPEIFSAFKNFDIKDKDGNISKEKLGKIVFSDETKRKELENILHKRIFQKINEFFDQNKNSDIVFVSVPLLFETNTQRLFDKIIFISADETLRLNRLMKRNNLTVNEAKKRIQSQMNEEEKLRQCDFVVYNNSGINELNENLESVLKELISP